MPPFVNTKNASDARKELLLRFSAVVAVFKHSFVGNLPRLVELCKALGEGLHSKLGAAMHNGFHLRDLVGANVVLYRVLNRSDAPLLVRARNEALRDNTLKHILKLVAHLVLRVNGADVDNAVDRLRSGGGVQRAEYKVSRFGCHHCKGDGFVVAHLADEDNVGVIAQDNAKYVAAQRIFPLEAPPIIRVTSKNLV